MRVKSAAVLEKPTSQGSPIRATKDAMIAKDRPLGKSGFKLIDGSGQIEAYVSVYGIIDSQNEVVDYGAFIESLKTKMPRICWSHDWTKIIGKTIEAQEVKAGDGMLPEELRPYGGLRVIGQLALDTQLGREAFYLLKQGFVDEFSIGYDYLDGGTYVGEDKATHLSKLRLYEWSPVLAGANPATVLIGAKAHAPTLLAPLEAALSDDEREIVAKAAKSAETAGAAAASPKLQSRILAKLDEVDAVAVAKLKRAAEKFDSVADELAAAELTEEVWEVVYAFQTALGDVMYDESMATPDRAAAVGDLVAELAALLSTSVEGAPAAAAADDEVAEATDVGAAVDTFEAAIMAYFDNDPVDGNEDRAAVQPMIDDLRTSLAGALGDDAAGSGASAEDIGEVVIATRARTSRGKVGRTLSTATRERISAALSALQELLDSADHADDEEKSDPDDEAEPKARDVAGSKAAPNGRGAGPADPRIEATVNTLVETLPKTIATVMRGLKRLGIDVDDV